MAMTLDEIAAVVNAAFPEGAEELAAGLAQLRVFCAQFPTTEESTQALAMLAARMDIEVADGVQRLVTAQVASATQAGQVQIQAAQARRIAAQDRFDVLVAQMAQG